MTAGSLRDLAAKATDRKLDTRTRDHVKYVCEDDIGGVIRVAAVLKGFDNEADATLDALAPDLAVLCADMADALATCRDCCSRSGGCADFDALLARFRALEAQTGNTA